MAEVRAGLDFTPRDDMPPELIPDPDHSTAAKTTSAKLPGGETVYSGSFESTDLTVRVDFAAMGLQLRYAAGIPLKGDLL